LEEWKVGIDRGRWTGIFPVAPSNREDCPWMMDDG
jgi:hypothetical protein